jgi:hypothetical protein
MKSKKGDKGESKTAVKVPALMDQTLLSDIRDLILSARRQVAQVVNAELTMLYWEIGRRIRQDILEEKRAPYGKEIVAALRRQLGWTHFKSLIPIEDPETRILRRNVPHRRLEHEDPGQEIQSMLHERTALSRKPEKPAEMELKALREIHVELENLNVEAGKLAVVIKRNFEELGA